MKLLNIDVDWDSRRFVRDLKTGVKKEQIKLSFIKGILNHTAISKIKIKTKVSVLFYSNLQAKCFLRP